QLGERHDRKNSESKADLKGVESNVDCKPSIKTALHFHCSGDFYSNCRCPFDPKHSKRHLSVDQYPGYFCNLQLCQYVAEGSGAASHHGLRTCMYLRRPSTTSSILNRNPCSASRW